MPPSVAVRIPRAFIELIQIIGRLFKGRILIDNNFLDDDSDESVN